MAKSIKLKVDLEKGSWPVVGDIQDFLTKIGGSGGSTAGYNADQKLGPAQVARIAAANAVPGLSDAAVNYFGNPTATRRSGYVGAAHAVGDALPSIGAAAGTAIGGPIGTAVGYGLGQAGKAGINYLSAESDAVTGGAEQEFGSILGGLGAAGIDASKPQYREGLERMARTIAARKAREYSNRKLVNTFSSALSYGNDYQGIWPG